MNWVSIVALVLSSTSLYFQFFHRPRRLRLITMPLGKDFQMRFGICNGGKESAYVTGMSVRFTIPNLDGSKRFALAGPVQMAMSIVEPGKVVEFSYGTHAPQPEFLNTAPEVRNRESGVIERVVGMEVYLQFAFPDGKIYAQSFESGSFAKAGDSAIWRTEPINLDLLRSAERVLDKKSGMGRWLHG